MIRGALLQMAALAVAVLPGASPSIAKARLTEVRLVALSLTGDTLYVIDGAPADGLKVTHTVKLKTKTSDRIVAFDTKASDGGLYGVSANSNVYKINWKNGKVAKLFSLPIKLKGVISMDCLPEADSPCRLVSDKGLNARIDLDSHKLTMDPPLVLEGKDRTPRLIAVAYTYASTAAAPLQEPQLVAIDAETDALYEQVTPDGSDLRYGWQLRRKVEAPYAFDIFSTEGGSNFGGVIYNGEFRQLGFQFADLSKPRKIEGLKASVKDLAFIRASM